MSLRYPTRASIWIRHGYARNNGSGFFYRRPWCKISGVNTLYTIGHGRHPFDYFLGLLRQHGVEFVIDVRAFARSRWPQYNGLVLAELRANCHRVGMLAPMLRAKVAKIVHILPNGKTLEFDESVAPSLW